MSDWLSRRLYPSTEALENQVGDETVILHLGSDTYFGLDPVGTRILELIKEGLSLGEVRDRVAEEYDTEAATVEADMRTFIEDLLRQGILLDA